MSSFLPKKFSSIISFFALDEYQRSAKRHVQKVKYKRSNSIVLVEAWQTPWNQLGLSLFLPKFIELFGGKPVNYYLTPTTNSFKLKQKIRQFFSVAKRYGISKIIFFGPTSSNLQIYLEKATLLIQQHENKRDFELLQYRGIRIGDLVYDQYLRASEKPTIDFSDHLLVLKLAQSLAYVDELSEYFDRNSVIAVCVSHTVYHLAIPSRIAVARGVNAYQVTGEHVYRMSKFESHAYADFKTYKSEFNGLDKELQNSGTREAESRLTRRFLGEVGVDMAYSSTSAFTKVDNAFQLPGKSSINILVAVHDFFDSPHAIGDNLFPDYMEWLEFLAKVSEDTNYSWYLKTHPLVQGQGQKILSDFISRHKEFKLLPADTSHHTLIASGINVALTVFGTIASEYAYLGKVVINASLNHPHVAFDFSLSPKSVSEYEELLLKLPETLRQFQPKREQVLEFYFMHHIYKEKSWTIVDFERALAELHGIRNLMSWPVFQYFALSNNSISIDKINGALLSYLETGDYRLNKKHFQQD